MEDVFLSGGDDLQAFRPWADGPPFPVETVHHVAGDAVFFVHHGDGLFRVVGRVALAAALGGPWHSATAQDIIQFGGFDELGGGADNRCPCLIWSGGPPA